MALKAREQRKWDSLQDIGQSHIDKILSASGTEADLTALSNILNEQHELAGQIFDQGVEDAVTTANAIVKRMDDERVAKGKKAMSDKMQDRMFQRTLKDVLATSIEDILGQIHDEFETQEKRSRERVADALSRIRSLPGERPGSGRQPAEGEVTVTREQRDLLDRFTDSQERRPEPGEDPERRTLTERILGRRRDQEDRERRTVLQVIREAATSAKDKISALYDRVRGRSGDDDEEKRATVWMRKLRAIFDPIRRGANKVKNGAGKLAGMIGMLGKPLLAALMSPQLIESITDAVSKYLNFDQISNFVTSMWEESKKMGSDALDAVVNKIKSFFGSDSKDKKTTTEIKKTKADPLTAPKPKSGPLDKRITPADAARDLPRRESQLDAAKRALTAAETAYKANPSAANAKAVEGAKQSVIRAQLMVDQFKGRASEGTTVTPSTAEVSKAAAAAAVTTAAPGEIPKPTNPTSADAADGGAKPQTSPVSPSAVLGSSSASPTRTEVVGDMPKYTPGKAVEDQTTKDVESEKNATQRGATAQVGMGSFGFESTDSSMNILNLGMLT